MLKSVFFTEIQIELELVIFQSIFAVSYRYNTKTANMAKIAIERIFVYKRFSQIKVMK